MVLRISTVLCLALLCLGCRVKTSSTTNSSGTTSSSGYSIQYGLGGTGPVIEEIMTPDASTSTDVENCNCVYLKLQAFTSTDKDDKSIVVLERAAFMYRHPTCVYDVPLEHHAKHLADSVIQELATAHPNDPAQREFFVEAKTALSLAPDAQLAKTVVELIDLYQSIDTDRAPTILAASKRLYALEHANVASELTQSIREALMREAMVYMYRHSSDPIDTLDAVIGAYPFSHVKNRFLFAIDIVECFRNLDTRAMPIAFLKEPELDAESRAKLLVALLRPDNNTEDFADDLDRRAETYVAAEYNPPEVQEAVISILIEKGLYADVLAFANKHFDDTHITHLEDRLMKHMRTHGHYSILEDPDGHKLHLYDFKHGGEIETENEE